MIPLEGMRLQHETGKISNLLSNEGTCQPKGKEQVILTMILALPIFYSEIVFHIQSSSVKVSKIF